MARRVIKYQETTVTVERTLSELSELIRRYGGSRFEQAWTEAGEVSGVRFAIRHESLGELPVHLTARTAEIERILTGTGLWKSYGTQERRRKIAAQSYRIAWRVCRIT